MGQARRALRFWPSAEQRGDRQTVSGDFVSEESACPEPPPPGVAQTLAAQGQGRTSELTLLPRTGFADSASPGFAGAAVRHRCGHRDACGAVRTADPSFLCFLWFLSPTPAHLLTHTHSPSRMSSRTAQGAFSTCSAGGQLGESHGVGAEGACRRRLPTTPGWRVSGAVARGQGGGAGLGLGPSGKQDLLGN